MGRHIFIILFLSMIIANGCTNPKEKYKVISSGDPADSQDEYSQTTQPAGESVNKTTEKEVSAEESSPPEKENPFFTKEEEESFKKQDNKIPLTHLVVSAIFYRPDNSKAIINGRVLSEGDTIENKEIVRIEPEEVILKEGLSMYTVKMGKVK